MYRTAGENCEITTTFNATIDDIFVIFELTGSSVTCEFIGSVLLFVKFRCQSKIKQFDVTSYIKAQVVWFQVSINDAVIYHGK
jgi:hypothetical protein